MNLKNIIIFCLAVSVSRAAWADLDIIAGIGGTSYEYEVNSGSTTNTESQNLSGSTTIRLGVGMSVNDWFKVEGLYVAYGRATTGYYFSVNNSTVEEYDYEMKPSALVAQALASYPLGEKYSLFGKLGIASWRYTVNSSLVRSVGGNVQFSGSDSGVDPLYGVGLERKLESGSRLRVDYEKLTLRSERDIKMSQIGFSYIYPLN